MRAAVARTTIVLSVIALISGCSARAPAVLDSAFWQKPTHLVTMLPIVDARKDKDVPAEQLRKELDELHKLVALHLVNKGFSVLSVDEFIPGRKIEDEAVAEMDGPALARLGPADAEVLFVLVLHDVTSNYFVVGKTARADISASLVDRRRGLFLWRDSAAESVGHLGLVAGLLPMRQVALQQTAIKILSSLPSRDSK